MKHLSTVLVLLLLATVPCFAKDKKARTLSQGELAAITARGYRLFEYHLVVAQADEGVTLSGIQRDKSSKLIARRLALGWVVAFGKLSESKDSFVVVAEITPIEAQKISVKKYRKPRQEIGYFRRAALAIDTALANFPENPENYSVTVLPSEKGDQYVYVYPSATGDGALPLGGDVRFLISADGKTLLERHQMHPAILESTVASDNNEDRIYARSAGDAPEDTDVLYALRRRLPVEIDCGGVTYEIAAYGGRISVKK